MLRPFQKQRQRRTPIDVILGILLALQVAGLTYAGLSPFSFSPQNQVEALEARHGLGFDNVSIATSAGELSNADDFPQGALTIHLMIRPDQDSAAGLGTILTIEDGSRVSPLIIGQWKSWLVIRVRDTKRAARGYWEMDAAGLPAGETHLVTITSGPKRGTAIYIDGIATGDTRTRTLIRGDRPLDGKLLLGCLGNGSAGWRGELLGLAILGNSLGEFEVADHYARVVEGDFASLGAAGDFVALYDFEQIGGENEELIHTVDNLIANSAVGRLEVPRIFTPLRPEVFGIPPLRDMKADWFLKDLLRNIAGFIPLGFVAGLILIRNRNARGYVITFQVALVGALLSVGIETIQIALPMRSSSLSDVTLNVIGTMTGAVIALAFRHSRLAPAATTTAT